MLAMRSEFSTQPTESDQEEVAEGDILLYHSWVAIESRTSRVSLSCSLLLLWCAVYVKIKHTTRGSGQLTD